MKSLALFLFVVVALCGCAKKPNDIVGTWNASRRMASSIFHFFPDGKVTTELHYDAVLARTQGTYTYDGTNLGLTNVSVDVVGPEPMASEVRAKLLEPSLMPIVWNSPFNFKMPLPGHAEEPLVFNFMSRVP